MINNFIKAISIATILYASSNATMVCDDFSEFKEYGGHYYTITANRMSFTQAMKAAASAGGYIAIPDNAGENSFLAQNYPNSWIGIYDPQYTQNPCIGVTCGVFDASRFQTVKNTVPAYTNWYVTEPNNLIKPNDVDKNGMARVSPLGEHWAIIGRNGTWGDEGNHYENLSNGYTAIFEFDSKPPCVKDANPEPVEPRKCIESIQSINTITNNIVTNLDGDMPTSTQGNVHECMTDSFGNEYCPAQLNTCGQEWDYDDGYSVEHGETSTDYDEIRDTAVIADYQCARSTGSLIRKNGNTWSMYAYGMIGGCGAAGWDITLTQVDKETYTVNYRLLSDYVWTGWRTKTIKAGETFKDYFAYGRDVGGFKIDLTKAVFYTLNCKTWQEVPYGDFEGMPVCKSCGTNLPATELTKEPLPNLGGIGWKLVKYYGGGTVDIEINEDKTKYYYRISAGETQGGPTKIQSGNLSGTIKDSLSYRADAKDNYSINFEMTNTYIKTGAWGAYDQVYRFNELVCYYLKPVCANGGNIAAAYVEPKIGNTCSNYNVGCSSTAFAWSVPTSYPIADLLASHTPLKIYENGTYKGEISSWNEVTAINNQCDGYGVKTNKFSAGCFDGKCNRGTGFSFCWNETCELEEFETHGGVGCESGCVGYFCKNSNNIVCPEGSSVITFENGKKGCKQNQDICKRTYKYTYYEYLCKNGVNNQNYNWTGPLVDNGGNCKPTSVSDLIDTNGDGTPDSCNSSNPPKNNCKREKYICKSAGDRPCVQVDGDWKCSPFPCFGAEDSENIDTKTGSTDSKNQGFEADGSCAGQIRIFNGTDRRCNSKYTFNPWKKCCAGDDGVLGFISQCKPEEEQLAKYLKKSQNQAHYVGEYCAEKLKFPKICIRKKKTYCTFGSVLGRIINEQGRIQLNKGWGSPEEPDCKGFTPEEFQKIDFDKIDMTEFTNSITEKVTNEVANKISANLPAIVDSKINAMYGGNKANTTLPSTKPTGK